MRGLLTVIELDTLSQHLCLRVFANVRGLAQWGEVEGMWKAPASFGALLVLWAGGGQSYREDYGRFDSLGAASRLVATSPFDSTPASFVVDIVECLG